MSMQLQALYDERAKLVQDTRELLERAVDRPETSEEREERERRDARFADLNTRIGIWKMQEQREAEEARLAESTRRIPEHPPVETATDSESRRMFREFLRGRTAGTVAETRDFSDASQNIGDNGDGGYLVPAEFERRLWTLASDANVMRTLGTVSQTTSGSLTIPYRASIPSATYEAEKGTYAKGNVEFLTLTISAHKIANSIAITEEMLTDSAFDIESEVINALAESIANLEETWFVTGNGTNQAYGVVAGATAGVTAASQTAIVADELISLYHALKQKYRARASWLMEDATILAIRKLKDGAQQYLWQPGLRAGEPDMLLGKPVIACEAVATIAHSAVPILFGDFSYYRIADRVGMRMIRDPYTNAIDGVIRITASRRTGGRLVISEAVQKLTMA